jgi:hypothetical protein
MTVDAILNILLTAGLPSLMALAGVWMAAKELPQAEARKWIGIFLFLGFLSIGLAIWQQIRTATQQRLAEGESRTREKNAEEKADAAERNRISDTQYMKGKLDTMSVVLGSVAAGSLPSGIGNAASGVMAALGAFAKQSQQETDTKRRADAQAHLGKLLTEGKQLSECYTAKNGVLITPAKQHALDDWSRRTYEALASEANPVTAQRFGEQDNITVISGQEKWLKTVCWATRVKVSDLETIMAQEFAPLLSEPERQRKSQAQKDIANVLAEGQRLRNKYCDAFPNGNQQVRSDVEAALSDWETKAYATVTGNTGNTGIDLWHDAELAYPGIPTLIQQRCGQVDMRLRALETVIRNLGPL